MEDFGASLPPFSYPVLSHIYRATTALSSIMLCALDESSTLKINVVWRSLSKLAWAWAWAW